MPDSSSTIEHCWNLVQLLHRYADAYDTRDIQLLRSCYADDAVFSSITLGGDERVFRGIDEILKNASNTFRVISATRRHQITNALVHVVGPTAYASSYLTLFEATPNAISVVLTGKYVDTMTLQSDDQWRIQSRVLHSDAEFSIPVLPRSPMEGVEACEGCP